MVLRLFGAALDGEGITKRMKTMGMVVRLVAMSMSTLAINMVPTKSPAGLEPQRCVLKLPLLEPLLIWEFI